LDEAARYSPGPGLRGLGVVRHHLEADEFQSQFLKFYGMGAPGCETNVSGVVVVSLPLNTALF
jgi:hypothetical protein